MMKKREGENRSRQSKNLTVQWAFSWVCIAEFWGKHWVQNSMIFKSEYFSMPLLRLLIGETLGARKILLDSGGTLRRKESKVFCVNHMHQNHKQFYNEANTVSGR